MSLKSVSRIINEVRERAQGAEGTREDVVKKEKDFIKKEVQNAPAR
jgi:hypothetical protein